MQDIRVACAATVYEWNLNYRSSVTRHGVQKAIGERRLKIYPMRNKRC
jgi:hypothetical protein